MTTTTTDIADAARRYVEIRDALADAKKRRNELVQVCTNRANEDKYDDIRYSTCWRRPNAELCPDCQKSQAAHHEVCSLSSKMGAAWRRMAELVRSEL